MALQDGFKILINIVENHSDKLGEISIFDEKMRDYTIEEFLDKIPQTMYIPCESARDYIHFHVDNLPNKTLVQHLAF